jgi:hypothetical protein
LRSSSAPRRPKLKLKFKNEQEGWVSITKDRRKYVLNFCLGDEEFDADELPNPMRKLIDTSSGGPNGNAVQLPPVKWVIRDYLPRPYVEYFTIATSHGKTPVGQRFYMKLAKMYLDKMGVPFYYGTYFRININKAANESNSLMSHRSCRFVVQGE